MNTLSVAADLLCGWVFWSLSHNLGHRWWHVEMRTGKNTPRPMVSVNTIAYTTFTAPRTGITLKRSAGVVHQFPVLCGRSHRTSIRGGLWMATRMGTLPAFRACDVLLHVSR
jgi:hypothetical protein